MNDQQTDIKTISFPVELPMSKTMLQNNPEALTQVIDEQKQLLRNSQQANEKQSKEIKNLKEKVTELKTPASNNYG